MSALNQSFWVILKVTGRPQQCPGFQVPKGATVRVLAHNNTATGNAALVDVSQYAEAGYSGDVLAALSEKVYPVDNTAHIYVTGTAGDGVLVTIKK